MILKQLRAPERELETPPEQPGESLTRTDGAVGSRSMRSAPVFWCSGPATPRDGCVGVFGDRRAFLVNGGARTGFSGGDAPRSVRPAFRRYGTGAVGISLGTAVSGRLRSPGVGFLGFGGFGADPMGAAGRSWGGPGCGRSGRCGGCGRQSGRFRPRHAGANEEETCNEGEAFCKSGHGTKRSRRRVDCVVRRTRQLR